MDRKLAWGILAAGRIAGTFARAVKASNSGRLVAVGSRRRESADRFGEEHGIPRRHVGYEALLADPEVEAIYLATPHPMHAEWAIKAAEAGKHILCEKPLALNHAQAMAVVEAAREHDVFLMEAFMYRCHPQTAKLVELIREGAIGEVRMVQATFSFNAGEGSEGRLFEERLGGGAILDVGCYAASMARLIAGAAVGRPFDDPAEVRAIGKLGNTGVDDCSAASLRFASGIVAQLAAGVRVSQENVVRVYGSEGWILVPDPWIPSPGGEPTTIVLHRQGAAPEEIVIRPSAGLYTLEADTVAAHIDERQAPSPAMGWDDSLGNMLTLDLWREAIGLAYEVERPETGVPPVSGRPLSVRPGAAMPMGRVEGVDKPIARLVMGIGFRPTMPETAVMFDDYFEQGGNCYDTAFAYGGGLYERLLGHWMRLRGVREQTVVVAKGCLLPYNRPEHLAPQLEQSLDRLQTDYADVYFAHRDNLEVPVGEWADAFNEVLRKGWARAYGGSNWTPERVDELNDYARRNGLVGMAAVSNNFSLAHMIEPMWAGCISSSDPESRAWLADRGIPLFAWSSLGQGFFGDGGLPYGYTDTEHARYWGSEGNLRRRERAEALAAERGVTTVAIALAHVICQPSSSFALIGPVTLEQWRTAAKAASVELSEQELRWLNLEADTPR